MQSPSLLSLSHSLSLSLSLSPRFLSATCFHYIVLTPIIRYRPDYNHDSFNLAYHTLLSSICVTV